MHSWKIRERGMLGTKEPNDGERDIVEDFIAFIETMRRRTAIHSASFRTPQDPAPCRLLRVGGKSASTTEELSVCHPDVRQPLLEALNRVE